MKMRQQSCFCSEADGEVQEKPAAARVSRSKTPTANAIVRKDGLVETVRPNAAPRLLASEAKPSKQGHPGMNESERQGAALAVGVCLSQTTNPAHAGLTIGGLNILVCFHPFLGENQSKWERPPCEGADSPGLYSRARCLKDRDNPRPTQP